MRTHSEDGIHTCTCKGARVDVGEFGCIEVVDTQAFLRIKIY